MKIEYATSYGCPHGQFIVKAESRVERAILAAFIGAEKDRWQFHMHGMTYCSDHGDGGPEGFNFGWSRRRVIPDGAAEYASWQTGRAQQGGQR